MNVDGENDKAAIGAIEKNRGRLLAVSTSAGQSELLILGLEQGNILRSVRLGQTSVPPDPHVLPGSRLVLAAGDRCWGLSWDGIPLETSSNGD